MPEKIMLNHNESAHKAWHLYLKESKVEKSLLRPIVYESWQRNIASKLDPLSKKLPSFLSEKELVSHQKNLKFVSDIATTFMQRLYDIVGNTDFIIRLTDKDGYILEHLGEKGFIGLYGQSYLDNGYCVLEEIIGTNAIGLAISHETPVQILGSEHFMKKYHRFTTSAAPILDENHHLIAVLSITGSYKMVHPHTLGMVIAASESITRELKLQKANAELQSMNNQFYNIMRTISEGIIATDHDGFILNANSYAKNLLDIKNKRIEKIHISKYIKNKTLLNKIYSQNLRLSELETSFTTEFSVQKKCIINVDYFKYRKDSPPKMVVLIVNETKTMHSMVNKIVGSIAIFDFDDIIGTDEKMLNSKKMAMIASNIDSTILLQGESGTGKEMFAQSIHNASNRKNKPFVFLNCGAIPRELVASELFGYVEGAFTGAKPGGHVGKFELADSGTIFLDEIGDMPLDAQISLLRVLETQTIVRVGSNDVIPVNVRVIAATNKLLSKEVETGNFREDLYYRLNVFPIFIDPLRARKSDIPILIDYFVAKFTKKLNKTITKIESDYYDTLSAYDWPGNVRELQNTIQLSLNILENNPVLSADYLPQHFQIKTSTDQGNPERLDALPTLSETEYLTIIDTLKKTNYNISKTSKILNIGRSTLYRKLEKHNINL